MKLEQKGTSNRKVHLFLQWFATPALPALLLSLCVVRSVPAEGDVTRPVASLLHQGFVKLPSRARVDRRPAVLAVVLQTGDVGAEERCKLPAAASSLALIAELVVQHVWLHFHLQAEVQMISVLLCHLLALSVYCTLFRNRFWVVSGQIHRKPCVHVI